MALTVGNMDVVDAGTAGKKNTKVRVVVPKGHAGEAKYAAETSGPILALLENYFGIPYPYDKLDEVAVPLSGLSMEHPGLITHSGFIILRRPDEDTLGRQREWASVCAHEMAHQWFGDLVTTAWWDDIWLNEGFASWMANKIMMDYHPEWQMNIGELNGYQGAMGTDSLVSARQVRQPIESNDDIANAFDSITYEKGSALLNMFESYMGPDKFRDGIRRYLQTYSWKNATSSEVLASLAGGDPSIAAAFSSFHDQPGVPLITATLKCEGGGSKARSSPSSAFFRWAPRGAKRLSSGKCRYACATPPPASPSAEASARLLERSNRRPNDTVDKASGLSSLEMGGDANADAVGYYPRPLPGRPPWRRC